MRDGRVSSGARSGDARRGGEGHVKHAYRDRREAGLTLAAEVAPLVAGPCVVAAIPRGGIEVAEPLAARLQAPLTLAFVRKLTLPEAPEYAIGAVDEDGRTTLGLDSPVEHAREWPHLAEVRSRVLGEIERQRAIDGAEPLAGLAPGATVVLVDDGLATGLTMQAAVGYARHHDAARVIVAVPCASVSAARAMERLADQFVCPWVDPGFAAVGEFYVQFPQVGDGEVAAALERARARRDVGEMREPTPRRP